MGLWLGNGPQNHTNSSRRVLGFTAIAIVTRSYRLLSFLSTWAISALHTVSMAKLPSFQLL